MVSAAAAPVDELTGAQVPAVSSPLWLEWVVVIAPGLFPGCVQPLGNSPVIPGHFTGVTTTTRLGVGSDGRSWRCAW